REGERRRRRDPTRSPFFLPTYLLPATSSLVSLPSHVATALSLDRLFLRQPPLFLSSLPPSPAIPAHAALPFLLSYRSSRTSPLPSTSIASSSVGHLCSSPPCHRRLSLPSPFLLSLPAPSHAHRSPSIGRRLSLFLDVVASSTPSEICSRSPLVHSSVAAAAATR
ncbi:hypothetical protein GW17_00062076, partial [Ensete ventricosum]